MRLRVCPAAGSQLPPAPRTSSVLATVSSFTLVRHLAVKKMRHADLTPGKALHLRLPLSLRTSRLLVPSNKQLPAHVNSMHRDRLLL